MKILVACEESQEVCKAFREKGHEAYSCDIQECSGGHPEWHIQEDVLPLLNGNCSFQPLVPITKEWEDWFIEECHVVICDIYNEPYNFPRTGCKGCPFALHLQKELDILEEYFPNERKQCEIIWKPVYDEYRRLGYRLKKNEKYKQMSLFDIIDCKIKEEE